MSPELFLEGYKSNEIDIWAFGAIVFELIEKNKYFGGSNE